MKQTNFVAFAFAFLLALSFASALVTYISPENGSIHIGTIPVFNATLDSTYDYSEIDLNNAGRVDYPDSSLVSEGLNQWYVVFYSGADEIVGSVQYFYYFADFSSLKTYNDENNNLFVHYISPLNGSVLNTIPVLNATLDSTYDYSEIDLNNAGRVDYPDSSLVSEGLNQWYVVFYSGADEIVGSVQYFYYDTTAPNIYLNGGDVTLTVGDVYTELATANDTLSGDLTANITVISTPVLNAAAAGTYVLTYSVMDNAGNAAVPVNRTITVNSVATITTRGGGGGGSLCNTQWSCTEWSLCNNGFQTRTCSYATNFCTPRATKPIESQTCVSPIVENTQTNQTETQSIAQTVANTAAGITGAVIGTTAGRWSLGIVIFLILVGLAWWIIAAKKRRAAANAKPILLKKSKK